MERVLVAEGRCHAIEYAVRADLSVPARDFLDDLGSGLWAADPEAETWPDDAQISHRDTLLVWFADMAEEGLPPYQRAVNDLDDGMWEFKIGAKRLSYYDADGEGRYTPKHRIHDVADSSYPDEEFWWYPDMDELLRLGFAFPKVGQVALPTDVLECEAVRREDLHHDEPSA